MKTLILLIIKAYWIIIPKRKRHQCIFRISCSNYVYQTTKSEGFNKGLLALNYRFQNCRSGFIIFENPIDGGKMMVLLNRTILKEEEISTRFIN